MRLHQPVLLLSALLVSVFLAPTAARTGGQATADEIIEKYFAAIGGRDVLTKVTSQRVTGTMSVSVQSGELKGPYELLAKVPNKARLYVQLDLTPMGVSDKMTLEQKFDGTAGWMLDSMQGDRQITGNQLDNMRNGHFPSPLLNYKAVGARVELQPRETLNGKSMLVLLLTPKAGSAPRLYFDPDTYMLVRMKMTVNSPEMGDLEQTRDFSDFRTVDGLKIPFQVINATSVQTFTMKLEKVENNVPIDDAVFSVKAPAVIR